MFHLLLMLQSSTNLCLYSSKLLKKFVLNTTCPGWFLAFGLCGAGWLDAGGWPGASG